MWIQSVLMLFFFLVRSYVVEARRLQKKYSDKIVLHVGLETEFIYDDSVKHVADLVERHSLDYFVGSVHHVRGIPIDMGEGLYKQVSRRRRCCTS